MLAVTISSLIMFKSYSDGATNTVDSSVIRVGLEGIYYNQSSMIIRNESVVFGYCVNNSFVKEITITSNGLTFTPYKDSFQTSGNYTSYKDALKAAKDKGCF